MITKPKVQKIRVGKWLEGEQLPTTLNRLENFEEPVRMEILRKAGLGPEEESLLVNYQGKHRWCLLTSQRLIWVEQSLLKSLLWKDITLAQQPPMKAAQIIREELAKDDITELEVFDREDHKYSIELEAGKPYYIVWSAILAFCNLSRPPDPIPLRR
jgi:hypothetical protein